MNFKKLLTESNEFILSLELVPGADIKNRTIDNTLAIAKDAAVDGRIHIISITDNPGGHPALMPDELGRKVKDMGIEVMIHLACRDTNRTGLESRALQLSYMGLHNILALTGDYTAPGFGGPGTPVFDLDSVTLTCMLRHMNRKNKSDINFDEFFTGCAVSPFKYNPAENAIQYSKLQKKISAGAGFIISQLGYDILKFKELALWMKKNHPHVPLIASLFHLTPRVANIFSSGKVPGATVLPAVLTQIQQEGAGGKLNRTAAIERTAKLGAVLKNIGYRGVHIGGIHKNFDTVGLILDKMNTYSKNWQDYLDEYTDESYQNKFYYYSNIKQTIKNKQTDEGKHRKISLSAPFPEKLLYLFLDVIHKLFFSHSSILSPPIRSISAFLYKSKAGQKIARLLEEPVKVILLGCQKCGDCAISHTAYLCPESGCPKHLRNGPCGGSRNGFCEVKTERTCIWVQAFIRRRTEHSYIEMTKNCVLPRLWELSHTSSWLNFHLLKDHQSASCSYNTHNFKCKMK
jgi:methylenetetrahydrofolate reductase (NADPH)